MTEQGKGFFKCCDCKERKGIMNRSPKAVVPHDLCSTCWRARQYTALQEIEILCLGSGDEGLVGKIYQLAHRALATCQNPHDDWRGAK